MTLRASLFVCRALLVTAAIAVAAPAPAADAPLKEDRIKFFIHDQVAGQLTSAELGGYLTGLSDILMQTSQDTAVDVPTCTDFGTVTSGGPQPELFPTNGGLANNLAIIDTQQELIDVLVWGQSQGSRVGIFVQDIQWCGAVLPNAIGCAPIPGSVFVVSLTAQISLRPQVIAHERGHNAGFDHRQDDNCALMQPRAGASRGCLNQAEAKAFWDLANINTGETCDCIDLVQMGQNQTWSLNPQGIPCDNGDACTASFCDVGFCEQGPQVNCDDSDPCTGETCDPQTGCSNPPEPDGTPCDDATLCNGNETCQSGSCMAGPPPSCDDMQFCNGNETCDSQLGCVAGTPPPLDDGIACTIDSCDEVGDVVEHTPDDAACANGAFCDGDESCNPASGCEAGTPPPLDDDVACTDDSCDEVGDVVLHTPNPSLCDDSDPCTAESCDAVTGCANDPIPECTPGVPAASPVGRALLVFGIVGAATLCVRARATRSPSAARSGGPRG